MTPIARPIFNDVEVYAEVKPVTECLMDVAQGMPNAGRDGDILILGRGSRHAWRYGGDGWQAASLTL